MSETAPRQVNIRVEPGLYRSLEATARRERRSIPQVVRLLIEEGLQHRMAVLPDKEDIRSDDIARAVDESGAFDWLWTEPDLYDDTHGEGV